MKPAIAPTGHNRTGLSTSPKAASALLTATQAAAPSSQGDAAGLANVRIAYARAAEPMGTMPPPPSLKGMAQAAIKFLQGERAAVLLDKLGERLAFERAGVRLYDALISKHDAYGTWRGGPSRADLLHIREQEQQHHQLLKDALESLGADPTVVTPSANVHAVASEGMRAVLADPRTNLAQCLEVILVAELADNDCWENLVDLAAAMGLDAVAAQAAVALQQEREHLENVRLWVASALSGESTGGGLAETFAARAARRAEALRSRDGRLPEGADVSDPGRGVDDATVRRRAPKKSPATRARRDAPSAGRAKKRGGRPRRATR